MARLKGLYGVAGAVAPRPAQRHRPDHPGDRHQHRLAGRRHRHRRVPLRLPRHRVGPRRRGGQPRHAGGAGARAAHRRRLRGPQPDRRHPHDPHQPAPAGRACDEPDAATPVSIRSSRSRPSRLEPMEALPIGKQRRRVGADDARRLEPAPHQGRARAVPGPAGDRRVRALLWRRTRPRSSSGRRSRCRRRATGSAPTSSAATCSPACCTAASACSSWASRRPCIGMVLGVSLGLISGYARRWVDESIMRMLDVVLAFPSVVLAMLFVSILGPQAVADRAHGRHLAHAAHRPRHARRHRGAGAARLRARRRRPSACRAAASSSARCCPTSAARCSWSSACASPTPSS